MGYFGRLEDKLKAQELRRQGLSYQEILTKIDVSKSTISDWCKDILLTEEQRLRLLNKKQFGQRKGSIIAAENKRNARIARTKQIREIAKKEIGRILKRDKFIAGISLYAAEGDKADGKGGFANSDPKLISFINKWFTEIVNLPISKLRGAIWLHDGLDEEKAREFWSNLTGIPLNQFHKTYVAKVKSDSKKVRKNIHQYGVFAIRFSDSAIHRKIMGWIYALFSGRIVSDRL